jgi:LytS/YehU family sensor histidine kinase
MTFIENVFKYGISGHQRSDIIIKISVEDNGLLFYCQNQIFSAENTMSRKSVGIENTKRRLQLLYPQKHNLFISTEGGLYTVKLNLQLHQ